MTQRKHHRKSVTLLELGAVMIGLGVMLGLSGAAQARVPSFCGESDSVFILAETADYWVNLCGGDLPHVLVISGKNDRKVIKADLDDRKTTSDVFVAQKSGVVYRFVAAPASKASLSAARGGQSLFKQPVVHMD
ncbi:hypothetical protein CCP2SC5_70071 [Azospirillaceae bacterium]